MASDQRKHYGTSYQANGMQGTKVQTMALGKLIEIAELGMLL